MASSGELSDDPSNHLPLFIKKEDNKMTFNDICTLSEICNRHEDYSMDEVTVAREMPQFRLDLLKSQHVRLLQNRMRWKGKLARMTDKYEKKKRQQKSHPCHQLMVRPELLNM